jgi:hypothetical protein
MTGKACSLDWRCIETVIPDLLFLLFFLLFRSRGSFEPLLRARAAAR